MALHHGVTLGNVHIGDEVAYVDHENKTGEFGKVVGITSKGFIIYETPGGGLRTCDPDMLVFKDKT